MANQIESEASNWLRDEFRGKRFLIVAGHFDYFGGAERQSTLLARELIASYGCCVTFLGWGGNGVFADRVREVGATPVVFALEDRRSGIRATLKRWELARFIRHELRPDYLLPFVSNHCRIVGSVWKRTRARFCWWNQRDEGRDVTGSRLERRLLASLPAVVSNSFEGRDFLVHRFGLAPGRINVIYNGVELPAEPDRAIWRERLQLQESDFLIAMVANLTRFKDHKTLLEAFSLLLQRPGCEHCYLVLAGRRGETADDLVAQAGALKIGDRISFVGVVADINELWAACDLAVHSSAKEGCPNAVLEAMALARAVVGTDISGIRQALGDDAVLDCMSAIADAHQLADRLEAFVISQDRRCYWAEKNQKRVQAEFSVGRMTERVLEVIHAACV